MLKLNLIGRIGFLKLCLIMAILGGCASAKLDPAAWRDSRIDLTWPLEPETPRIRLLRVVNGPEDVLVANKGAVGKFLDLFAGYSMDYIGFYTPHGMAADGDGLLYIADPSLGLIHKYNLASHDVTFIVQAGGKPFGSPVGVALDKDKNLYVTDSQTAGIYKLNQEGALIKELDGKGMLKRPAGIALTSKGDKVVADIEANKIFIFGSDDLLKNELPGPDFPEKLNMPTYVAVDKADNIYVTDTMNFTVRIFDSNGKYIRSQGQIGDTPGSFARPKGIATDSDRNLYVMDAIFGNFQIFNPQGRLLLYVSQEGALPGEFMLPTGIFIDRDDRIYVSDSFNHRIQVFQYLKQGVQQ
ncbi:MAG TPA: 6-bladed beta-propeller [Desulfuromonadaceae bacterium]|jgi:sugar lactone lactonase YvrE